MRFVGWIPSDELILFYVGASHHFEIWLVGANENQMNASLDFARAESSFLVFTDSHPGTSPCLVPLAYKCWCWYRFRHACAYAGFAVLVLMLISRCLCESCRRGRVCL